MKQINQINDTEFPIDKDTIYSFTISNENYLYSFTSEAENIFYVKLDENYEIVPNRTFFRNGEVVFVNWETSLKESTTIKISPIPFYKELNSLETIKKINIFLLKQKKNLFYILILLTEIHQFIFLKILKKKFLEMIQKLQDNFTPQRRILDI